MFKLMLTEQGDRKNSEQTVPDSTEAFHVPLPVLNHFLVNAGNTWLREGS